MHTATRQSGHDVLNGRNRGTCRVHQTCAKRRPFDRVPKRRDQSITKTDVGAFEPDAMLGRSRTNRQTRRLARMQTNSIKYDWTTNGMLQKSPLIDLRKTCDSAHIWRRGLVTHGGPKPQIKYCNVLKHVCHILRKCPLTLKQCSATTCFQMKNAPDDRGAFCSHI